MSTTLDLPDGSSIHLDEHGHLLDRGDWGPAVVEAMARADGLKLSKAHWLVIELMQRYYQDYGIEPPMRALAKQLRDQGVEEQANSRALYRLFPEGPVRQGSRYAGLPLPVSCI